MNKVLAAVRALRPAHWVKNLMVPAAAFFSGRMDQAGSVLSAAAAFVVFCLAASAVYLFNDMVDLAADRAHERKRLRPLASGDISPAEQRILLAVCAAGAASGVLYLPWPVMAMAGAYTVLMAVYSLVLKRWWHLGAAAIGMGMLARIFAGAEAVDVCVSQWVLPCTFFLTCYVVLGKRIYDGEGGAPLMRAVFAACGLATVICYAAYCLYDTTLIKYQTRWIVLTAAPVAAGLWRYARFVKQPREQREHLQALLTDPVTAVCLAAWLLIFSIIIYV